MEYRKIEEFPNYEINENAEIRNKKTGRILKPYLSQGYYRISLIKEKNIQMSAAVHRLLAIAFIPNKEKRPIIDHINQDKTDNRISNLRWSTYKENANNVDPIKRKHKTRIKHELGLLLCIETNKWVLKNKKIIVYYDNIDDAIYDLKKLTRSD